MQFITQIRYFILLSAILMTQFMPLSLKAADMMGGYMSCPMCGTMGWGGMIFGGLLMLAVIGALVSLVIYLLRRSRTLPR